jgi:hypothetical protein
VETMTARKAARKRRKVEARMIEMCVSRYQIDERVLQFYRRSGYGELNWRDAKIYTQSVASFWLGRAVFARQFSLTSVQLLL